MRSRFVSLLLAAISQAGSTLAASPLYETTINITDFGVLKGRAALNSSQGGRVPNWQDISFFGAVPYGADTSGDLRWSEPARATAWNGTLDTVAFGPLCPSSSNTPDMIAAYGQSEDCLTLNIWTPASTADVAADNSSSLLPVVFFTHDDLTTAPGDAIYDGSALASKGVVFVSYNFRSGVLGFFADPALNETWGEVAGPTGHETGNWGILDQLHALKWVYANIALFGGNPDHISVVGTGSGAAAVWHILNSGAELGEFDINPVNAIAQSGLRSPLGDPLLQQEASAGAYYNQSYAETLAIEVLESLNVTTTAEARALPYEQLVDATAATTFRPVLEYYLIPDTYAETLLNGSSYKVPFITGHNADELSADGDNVATSAYSAWLEEQYGSSFAEKFLALYPESNSTETLLRDQARVSSWQFMDGYHNSSDESTYTYYFTLPNGAATKHSEVVYALGNLWAQPDASNYTAEDYHISDVLSTYWVNFIKTGDPNNSTEVYYGNVTLPTVWEPNSATEKQTFQVGSEWGDIPIAGTSEKVALFEDFFAAQTPA
ncbi:hypothetical protein N0V82_009769 [Gnomoniopsis sp. IMI 355080]|nr:hypothetical protein N0V82_009769 [Gnomoniopsis sp. IMI 355080]